MLTRKQRWRRVHHQRSFVESTPMPAAPGGKNDKRAEPNGPPPSHHPHPIDSLSLGDLLQVAGSPSSSPAPPSSPTASPCPPPAVDDPQPAKSVCFHHQVRVILVPSRQELRGLQLQLWWGADDYHHFRREYVLLLKMAAEKQQQQSAALPPAETQPTQMEPAASPPPSQATAAAAEPSVAENNCLSVLPSGGSAGVDIIRPPCPIVKLSEIVPSATVVDGAAGKRKAEKREYSGDADRAGAAAPGVVLVKTSIPPQALSAAAAAAVAAALPGTQTSEQTKGDFGGPTLARAPARGRGPVKWTPHAGAAAAAAAAAEAEFEDYRTSSMSSASESDFGDDRDFDEDDDDDDVHAVESAQDDVDTQACDKRLLYNGVNPCSHGHARFSAIHGTA